MEFAPHQKPILVAHYVGYVKVFVACSDDRRGTYYGVKKFHRVLTGYKPVSWAGYYNKKARTPFGFTQAERRFREETFSAMRETKWRTP